jgi:hypothetical protein
MADVHVYVTGVTTLLLRISGTENAESMPPNFYSDFNNTQRLEGKVYVR